MIHNYDYVILDKENLDARIERYKNEAAMTFPELLHMLDINNLSISYKHAKELLNFLHEEIIKYNKTVLNNNSDAEFYVIEEDDETNDNGSDYYYIGIHKVVNYKMTEYLLVTVFIK